jgi:hypothetical protein
MKVRACILILLLIGQPLSAVGAVWQSAGADDFTTGHCDSGAKTAQHQPASGDDHSDCIDSCDLCAACAAAVNAGITTDEPHVRSDNSQTPLVVMPPGQARLLYRPPIQS